MSQKFKTGTVILLVDYSYDWHDIIFSGRTWKRIQCGVQLVIRGQGFRVEGIREQDFWQFNANKLGEIYIYSDGGRQIFQGQLSDAEVSHEIMN